MYYEISVTHSIMNFIGTRIHKCICKTDYVLEY